MKPLPSAMGLPASSFTTISTTASTVAFTTSLTLCWEPCANALSAKEIRQIIAHTNVFIFGPLTVLTLVPLCIRECIPAGPQLFGHDDKGATGSPRGTRELSTNGPD